MKKGLLTLTLLAAVVIAFAANNGNSANKNNPAEPVAAPAANTNTVIIAGKVIDFTSGEALAGVEVAIEGTTKKVYTDFDGNFKIADLKPGNYNVIASYISYNKSFIEKLNVEKSNSPLNIKLQSEN